MGYWFDICCGEGEEEVKEGGFVAVEWGDGRDDDETESTIARYESSSRREKAAVVVQLKHEAKVCSVPLDVEEEVQLQTFDKTESDRDFLKTAMEANLLFAELSPIEVQTLVDATEKIQASRGDTISRQNEKGDYLHLVQSGRLSMYCEVAKKRYSHVEPGQVIGELALLYGQTYPLSAIVSTDTCILWRIEHQTFRYVLARHARNQDQGILASLRKIKLFQKLRDTELQKFAAAMTRVSFTASDRIITKGEVGEVFYVLETGSVRVHDVGMGDSQAVGQILKPGDSFGERSLMTGEPRAASITALEDVTTLAMDRTTFEKCIGKLEEMILFQDKLHRLKSLPILADSDVTEVEMHRLAELMHEVCYRKGFKLCEVGKPYPSQVWFIQRGQLLVYGKSGKIFDLRTGDYFGEKSILGSPDHLSSHAAVCEDNICTWVLSRDVLESVLVDLTRLGAAASFVQTKQTKRIARTKDLRRHRVLGKGGFGKVWLVEHNDTSTVYALKIVHKRMLLESQQEKSVIREKDLLSLLHHPFILYLVSSFQDDNNLYMVLPLVQGGELFSVLANQSKRGRGLLNRHAAFYVAAVVEALGHFHHRHIAYRDLKLENVMIDADGYIKIVDLGFAKVIVEKSFTFCGTPDYLAPEIIMSRGHNHSVDYWSLGVLAFELLAGKSPFNDSSSSQMEMFKRIVLMKYGIPTFVDDHAQNLIKMLLVRNVSERLGMMSGGHFAIREHPWFHASGINYNELLKKEIAAPWIPKVKDPLDSSNFDQKSGMERDSVFGSTLTSDEQDIFVGF